MNKFILACTIIIALLLNSCEPPATFDQPQPADTKPLTSFPNHIKGNYLSADNASVITVTDKLLTQHFDFDFKEHKDSMGSSYQLIADTLINLADGTKEKVLVKGDIVIQHANWTDTLFNLSKTNVLKKYKGYYFLNRLHDDNAWELEQISLAKGLLTIASVSAKDDLKKLKEITKTTANTTSTNFSLTRRQFKTFVKNEGFNDKQTFTRMANTR